MSVCLVVVRGASGGAHVPHSGAGWRLLPLFQECPVFGVHVIVLQGDAADVQETTSTTQDHSGDRSSAELKARHAGGPGKGR